MRSQDLPFSDTTRNSWLYRGILNPSAPSVLASGFLKLPCGSKLTWAEAPARQRQWHASTSDRQSEVEAPSCLIGGIISPPFMRCSSKPVTHPLGGSRRHANSSDSN